MTHSLHMSMQSMTRLPPQRNNFPHINTDHIKCPTPQTRSCIRHHNTTTPLSYTKNDVRAKNPRVRQRMAKTGMRLVLIKGLKAVNSSLLAILFFLHARMLHSPVACSDNGWYTRAAL